MRSDIELNFVVKDNNMSGREGGKKKPLKAPKKDAKVDMKLNFHFQMQKADRSVACRSNIITIVNNSTYSLA